MSNDSTERCVQLDAFTDSVLEDEETLLVVLTSPNHQNAIVMPDQATVAIIDQTGIMYESLIH